MFPGGIGGIFFLAKLLEGLIGIAALGIFNKLLGALFGFGKVPAHHQRGPLLFHKADAKFHWLKADTKGGVGLWLPGVEGSAGAVEVGTRGRDRDRGQGEGCVPSSEFGFRSSALKYSRTLYCCIVKILTLLNCSHFTLRSLFTETKLIQILSNSPASTHRGSRSTGHFSVRCLIPGDGSFKER